MENQEKKSEEKKNTEFNWNKETPIEFFGVKNTQSLQSIEEEEVDDDEPEVLDTKSKIKNEPETEVETPNNEDEPEPDNDEPETEDEPKEDETVVSDFTLLAKDLKENNILNVDLPEEEITAEILLELHEKEIETRVEDAFKNFAEDLDEEAKDFIKYKREGGDTQKFFEASKHKAFIPDNIVLEDNEENQEKVVRYYYSTVEKLDEEDINDKVAWLKETNKLAKHSEKNLSRLKEEDEKARKELVRLQEENNKAIIEERKSFIQNINTTLAKVEKVGDFTFTQKDKKELGDYIVKATEKFGNGYVSGFQKDLQEVLSSPEKLLVLSKLLKTNFSVDSFIKKGKTEKVKEVKTNLERGKRGIIKTLANNGEMSSGKALADVITK